MVLAVWDGRGCVVHSFSRMLKDVRVHPAAGSGARTCVLYNIKALFLRNFTHSKCAFKVPKLSVKSHGLLQSPIIERESPYDSNASEILTGSPFLYPIAGQSTCRSPTCIVPPYTMIVGRLCRTAAIAQPGIFLSHPGRDMLPS